MMTMMVTTRTVSQSGGMLQALRLLVVFALLSVTLSERVFHNRDGSDTERPDIPPHAYSVNSYGEALTYLKAYGYLNCSLPRQKRDLPSLGELVQETSSRQTVCSRDHITEGFEKLQARFKLPLTGIFDMATQKTMSSRRCGNSDLDEIDPNDKNLHSGNGENAMNAYTDEKTKPRVRRDLRQSTLGKAVLNLPSAELSHAGRAPFNGPHKLHERSVTREETIQIRRNIVEDIRKRREEEAKINPLKANQSQKKHTRKRQIRNAFQKKSGSYRLRRQKRRISKSEPIVLEDTTSSKKFVQNVITWKISNNGYSSRIPRLLQAPYIEAAFRRYSEVAPIKFRESVTGDQNYADVLISFGVEDHGCEMPFDGPGGVLAHTLGPQLIGGVHFDDDENYADHKAISTLTGYEDEPHLNFLKVALHESGHVLGLSHTSRRASVMFPIYISADDDGEIEITREDRQAVQSLYGICKGRFDVALDWVRKKERPEGNIYVFNTYFFRDDRYWMYENSEIRPRHGDPLYININWRNLPDHIDGCAQVITLVDSEYKLDTYFFKDDQYYQYNDTDNKVMPGYPKLISEGFGAKTGSNHSRIPDNIDTVYYDTRSRLLMFFKGLLVYAYDPMLIGQNGCCESITPFSRLYTMADNEDSLLEGYIDVAYRSFAHGELLFLVGEDVYVNVGFRTAVASNNTLIKHHLHTYEIWRDICDPDVSTS